jgi:hypothetical protein
MKSTATQHTSVRAIRATGALAMLSAVSVGCATGEGWNAIKTKNFTVYTNTTDHYKDTLRQLENVHAALASSFFRGDQEMGNIDVLFVDDVEFRGLMGEFRQGAAVAKVPGDGKIGKDGLLILRPHVNRETDVSVAQGDPTANLAGRAAAEMLSHIFIQRRIPSAPLWFHEGFSAYATGVQLRAKDNQNIACFGYLRGVEALLPLKDVWDMSFEGYADGNARGWFQSTAFVLMDYIMHGENNVHREKLGPFVNGIAAGEQGSALVSAAFPAIAPEAFEKSLATHREMIKQGLSTRAETRGQCPFGFVIPADKTPVDPSTAQSTPVPPAEITALLKAIEALPMRTEYPPYYPPEVVEKVKVTTGP